MKPVVLVATVVAFPGEPRMVLARFAGSFATACVMGWLWHRFGRPEWITSRARRAVSRVPGGNRWAEFAETARHDLVEAGGFLVLGALAAAALTAMPLVARLVFLVVGPAVDIRLIALQAGTFGRGFAARFAPLTFVVAVTCALFAGALVLGGLR